MHFSIPDSVEVKGKDSTYLVYNIHINGNLHCQLRYRQILSLHEQLKKEFGIKVPPHFPPKKFLSLTFSQLEERRCNLEKYIQSASQNFEVASSELFNGFLRLAQHETGGEGVAKRTKLDVFLPFDGQKISIDILNNSSTSTVLNSVASELNLPLNLIKYFGLYIFRKEVEGTWNVLRKLDEYESPYITIKWLTADHRIILRKCCWDLTVDDLLVDDKVGLHLIYLQTVADIENGWIFVPKEILKQLTSLQSQGNKKEYIFCARRLKFYGHMKFKCQSDYFQSPNVIVYIGNKERPELIIVMPRKEEIHYKITRMKCWRITLQHDRNGTIKSELSFEYLQSKDKLDWITLQSEQATIIALCLQEIVSEMVAKQLTPSTLSNIGTRSVRNIFYYINRIGEAIAINDHDLIQNNGSNELTSIESLSMNGSQSSLVPGILGNGSSGNGTPTSNLSRHNSYDTPPGNSLNGKRRSSNNSLRHQNSNSIINSNDNLLLENSAFNGIGDDDL